MEVQANGFKALRLLTDSGASLVKVSQKFPEMLLDLQSQILENLDNIVVMKEARGLIYNFKQVNSGAVPVELARLISGYEPEKFITSSVLKGIYSDLAGADTVVKRRRSQASIPQKIERSSAKKRDRGDSIGVAYASASVEQP